MAKPTKREILKIKKATIDGMVSYMKYGGAENEDDPDFDPDFDAGYRQVHINRCAKIIEEFLASLDSVEKKNEAILKVVKKAVVKLNRLNEQCDGCLIETDQREQLCELIISAAKRVGLVSTVYDITEEWRDW
jgi:hypothetical protein